VKLYFADYVLPMGIAQANAMNFTHMKPHKRPVVGVSPNRAPRRSRTTWIKYYRYTSVNPGEVWEENEFWIDLSWRIDPDGSLGNRQFFESKQHPGEKLSVDEY